MIRVDALWLSTTPLDMRAGTETILARVVSMFGEARPHHAYLFTNRRANRLKVEPAPEIRTVGYAAGRKRVQTLMKKMGIEAIYRKPNTSQRHAKHPIYPYLLRNRVIDRANQVWSSDITYIPMRRGFVYLCAIIDWYSRRVLAWRLSSTLTTDFCVEAVEKAITRYGRPEIFNTDQGSQFTSAEFTGLLKANSIQISMDGKDCWRDNVFVERLWRSIKYEEVYLKAYDCVSAAKAGLGSYFQFYNTRWPALCGKNFELT